MTAPAATTRRLPPHEERTVAVKAQVDPRTVRRVLAGESVRPMVRDRVVDALRSLGYGAMLGPTREGSR